MSYLSVNYFQNIQSVLIISYTLKNKNEKVPDTNRLSDVLSLFKLITYT